MTYEEDIQVKVLILIFKDHRIRSVAVPGAACLPISCATAAHCRDSKALSPLRRPVDLIAEGRRRIWTCTVQQSRQLFLWQLIAVTPISLQINCKAALT